MLKKNQLKRKKLKKFYELSFKLSSSKKEELDILCIENGTSINKILRSSIYNYIEAHKELLESPKKYVPKNQLKLFNVEEYDKGGFQIEMNI